MAIAKPNWSNQTLWTGDNLPILRGMNSACVELIYLDPPFNSNANYGAPIGSKAAGAAFKDSWGLDDINLAWWGEIRHENEGLYDLLGATRQIHGDSMMSYLIYMAIRIMEMRRILKPTGLLYLHCDPTAAHYLKLLLDCVFGKVNFRNEIIWHYDGPQRPSKKNFGVKHDIVFRYSKTENFYSCPDGIAPFQTLQSAELKQYKKHSDGNYYYTTPRGDYTEESISRLDKAGRVEWTKKGKARIRHFLPKNEHGVVGRKKQLHDVWSDISSIGHAGGKERLGYPTQKPLALLKRIILASSNRNDMILDPFCGCATTCIAAEIEHRQWAGIDISAKAAELVQSRMEDEIQIFFKGVHRTDIPKRTDLVKTLPYNHPHNKRYLYGEQGGYCNGCEEHFLERNLTIDHIIPRSKGGTDHISNLQLLCGHCNSIKGDRSQEYLLKCLTDKGWIKRKHSL